VKNLRIITLYKVGKEMKGSGLV